MHADPQFQAERETITEVKKREFEVQYERRKDSWPSKEIVA